jgi:drug/metabolite transporter (DMT)-like permease
MEQRSHLQAITEGVLIALILGSTLVLAKIALTSLGPLTIAAVRYTLAFFLLLPFLLHRGRLTGWSSRVWGRFFLIGLSFYVIGNGSLIWGVRYLPATTASLLLSLVPLLVLLAGIIWLKETPARTQLVGVLIGLGGCILFFSSGLKAGEPLGLGIVAVGLLGNAMYGVLGREMTKEPGVDTLSLTAIPLGLGSAFLLPLAFVIEGWPKFEAQSWGIVLLLAVVHTAVVYLLYNHALRLLAAFELSVLVNLSPLFTALWAWLLLGELLGPLQLTGMLIVIIGAILVQWRRSHVQAKIKGDHTPS